MTGLYVEVDGDIVIIPDVSKALCYYYQGAHERLAIQFTDDTVVNVSGEMAKRIVEYLSAYRDGG